MSTPLVPAVSNPAAAPSAISATAAIQTFTWQSNLIKSIPFFAVHLACLGAIWTGVSTLGLVLCAFFYFIRMFGITAGYHRYFSHRAFKTSRWFQFVLAWLGCSALQKGPLWWASYHRHHHKFSDTEQDVHSPITNSVWWAHLGWVIDQRYEQTDWHAVRDLSRYPELRWLNTNYWIPGIVLAVLSFLIGGFSALLWVPAGTSDLAGLQAFVMGGLSCLFVGFFLSTVLLYHAVFSINSLCHIFGNKRYDTTDESRNNFWLALMTLGEGWHNNHHYYQSSANQGFFWWEVDISYSIIWTLEKLGIVWGVRRPPAKKLLAATRPESTPAS